MKKIKHQYIILFVVFNVVILQAQQYPNDTNYQTIQTTTPNLPNWNAYFIDNSVPDPIAITRITEYNANWNWYPIHEYAKIQPYNADTSVYKFYSVAIYDANTHQMIRELPGGAIYPSYWSNTDPDIIYGFKENGAIKSYSIAADVVTDLDVIQGYELVTLGPGEGNIDKNDHYVAFIGKSGSDMDVIVYNLQSLQIVKTQTFPGAWGNGSSAPQFVDWVSVSQSGDYVGVMWNHNTTSENNPLNGHFGVEIYESQNMQYLRRVAVYGNHGDFGVAQDGDEVFVQFWGETGTVNMYYLNRMERVVLSVNADFNVEGHISCRNLNRPGWAYISQDTPQNSGIIGALKLDTSGTFEYFGHHFSNAATYDESPMPCPSPKGDKVMFKSDWGNTQNTNEIFVFEATKATNVANTQTQLLNNSFSFNNPIKENIKIKSEDYFIENVVVINAIGAVVKNVSFLNKKDVFIDVSNLENGIYFLRINNSVTKKIIIYR